MPALVLLNRFSIRFPLVSALGLVLASALVWPGVAAADHDGVTAPNNDSCSVSLVVSLNGQLENQTNQGAHAENSAVDPGDCTPDAPTTCGSSPYGHTVWYSFDVLSKGTVTIATSGTSVVSGSLDTVLTLVTPSVAVLACNDEATPEVAGGSSITRDLQPGTYYVQVGGYDYGGTTGPDRGSFTISVRYTEDLDRDDDGSLRPQDCDDDNPNRKPGLADVANDVDDNCDDVVDPDEDGDGYPRRRADGSTAAPYGNDCIDTPGAGFAIHPGAREVRGNRVDENCDDELAPFERIKAVARVIGTVGRSFRWTEIHVDNVP